MEEKRLHKIIKKCIDGNRKYQSDLYHHVYRKFFAICFRYSNNRDEADEIFQQSMIKIFNKLESFKQTGEFDAWCRRIIVNTAIDYIRKQKNIFNTINENNLYELADETETDDNYPDLDPKNFWS